MEEMDIHALRVARDEALQGGQPQAALDPARRLATVADRDGEDLAGLEDWALYGVALIETGEDAQALQCLEGVMEASLRRSGPFAIEVARTRVRIALALYGLGRFAQAEAQLLLAVAVLPLGTEEYVEASGRLAEAVGEQGRWDEAADIAVPNRERGEELGGRARMLAALTLAWVLSGQQRWEEALPEATVALGDAERLLGADHPMTLRVRHRVAVVLAGLGRRDEAITLAQRVLDDRARVLGPDHPHTVVAHQDLDPLRAIT